MVTLLLLLRFIKSLAVALLFTGSLGALIVRDLEERRKLAYRVAGPAFGATWVAGFGLVGLRRVSLLSGWILCSMLLSVVSINGVLYVAGKAERRGPLAVALIVLPLVAIVALMVFQPF